MEKSEVICISSEDEEDIQNGRTDAEASTSKKSDINDSSHPENKVSSKSEAETGIHIRKRTTQQENNDNDCPPKKRIKLLPSHREDDTEGNTVDVGSNGPEHASVSNGEERETVLKPMLVERKREVVSDVTQDPFPMFVSLCLQKDHSEDMKRIVNRLKRKYEQLDPAYAHSSDFIDFLNNKRNIIANNENKLFIYILEVMDEMKINSIENSNLLLNGATRKKEVSSLGASTSTSDQINHDSVKTDNADYKGNSIRRKQIKLIEKTMVKCEKKIKKLEQAEVDFDDDNNSDYIKLEKFKHRMVELYTKYCELTGSNADAERSYLRPKHFKTTKIEAVNMAISSFINSKISKRHRIKKVGGFANALIFPDYRDILQCVQQCNKDHNLGLDERTQKQIAKEAFTSLGEHLQRARRDDFLDTFSLFFEEKDEDPALRDPVLAEKLKQSKKEGEMRLQNVFQEYVRKQEEARDQVAENRTREDDDREDNSDASSENEDDSQDTDDNNSESSSVDDKNDNLEEDRSSTSHDQPSTSINVSLVKNKNSAGNVKTNNDAIEMNTNLKKNNNSLSTSDKLNTNGHTNLKSTNTKCAVKTLNCEDNSKSQVQKTVKDVISPHLSVSSDVTVSATVTDTVSPGTMEEGESKVLCEESIDNTLLEEHKPVLRVRSFAKPPKTWQDECQIVDGLNIDGSATKVVTIDATIDLTNESQKQNTVISKYSTVQIGSKILPVLKGKYRTFVMPKGKNIITVKNITNNYVSLDPLSVDGKNVASLQKGKLIKSRHMVFIPSDSPVQTAKTSRLVKSSEGLKKNSVVRVGQFKKVDSVSSNEQANTSRSTTMNLTHKHK